MNRLKIYLLLISLIYCKYSLADKSALDCAVDIYKNCLNEFSTNCIKPKALKWFSQVADNDQIKITDNLLILKTGNSEIFKYDKNSKRSVKLELLDKIDNFLATHSLKIDIPEIFNHNEVRSFVPKSFLAASLSQPIQIPLTEDNAIEGRGFVKKVMIPFLLGLKFKTTVLVPIALALIALKTWKAMTLGLLSLVLSGALLIFKIAKPKFVNYEVVHYPHHHVEHHVDHIVPHHVDHIVPHHIDHIAPSHIEHIVPHHVDHIVPHHVDHIDGHHHHEHIEAGWDPHAWARSSDAPGPNSPPQAQELAYNGHI